MCGYAYDYDLPGETVPFPRLSLARGLVLWTAGNTADALEQSGIAESMRRIYANDRLQPGFGVARCEFVLLSGTADPETAPQARVHNLATAHSLGRNFLASVPG